MVTQTLDHMSSPNANDANDIAQLIDHVVSSRGKH